MEQQDKKVLCVGLVCLDIISVVDKYPEEDSDSRLAAANANSELSPSVCGLCVESKR